MLDVTDAELRADIRRLGHQLGRTLVRQHGRELLDDVERVRTLSRRLRRSSVSTETSRELAELLTDTDLEQAMRLVRAFTVYFHLANVLFLLQWIGFPEFQVSLQIEFFPDP